LKFADAEDSLGTPEIPSLTFTASTREPPATARFQIAVSARGVVQHCFLDVSSGDPALDEQSRSYLLLCRFPAMKQSAVADDRLLWTSAILEWGTDIAIPAPTSTGPAAP
jgi:hypothetical protein